jgi:hypothetical protein
MMKIGKLEVTDSGSEYAVIPFEGCILECDTYAEAVEIAQVWAMPVLKRRWYVTEWEEMTQAS